MPIFKDMDVELILQVQNEKKLRSPAEREGKIFFSNKIRSIGKIVAEDNPVAACQVVAFAACQEPFQEHRP